MKYIVMPFLAVLLSCVSAAGEDIIDSSWSCHNNGNGAINCTSTWGENWGVYQVSISGDQFLTPGFMLTQFDTYSADDPTSNVVHFITNDSDNGLGWVAYSATVELYASSPLTSSLALRGGEQPWELDSIEFSTVHVGFQQGAPISRAACRAALRVCRANHLFRPHYRSARRGVGLQLQGVIQRQLALCSNRGIDAHLCAARTRHAGPAGQRIARSAFRSAPRLAAGQGGIVPGALFAYCVLPGPPVAYH